MADDIQILLSQLILSVEAVKQQNATIQAELTDIRQRMSQITTQAGQGWLKTRPAAAALASQGVSSPKQLKDLVAIAVLRIGTEAEPLEVRNVGTALQPRYEFHIPRCEAAIAQFKSLTPEERQRRYGRSVA